MLYTKISINVLCSLKSRYKFIQLITYLTLMTCFLVPSILTRGLNAKENENFKFIKEEVLNTDYLRLFPESEYIIDSGDSQKSNNRIDIG